MATAPAKGNPAKKAPVKVKPVLSVKSALAAKKAQDAANASANGTTGSVPAGNGKYAWGGGKPTHTISEQQHTLDRTPLDAPQSYQGALAAANAQGDVQYGPQIQAAQQLAQSTPAWFKDFQAQVAGYKAAALAQSQPLVTQANALAAPATDPAAAQAQVPAGLDPNSDAGKAAVLAAQGRAALAALGAQALGGEQQATQDYLTGIGANAGRALPQIQAGQQQQIGALQGQRGQAVNTALDTARTNAQNYAIAQGTLGLNTAKATSDASQAAADSAQAAKDKAAGRAVTKRGQDITATNAANRTAADEQKVNKYGFTNEQWGRFSASHRQRVIDQASTKTAKPTDPATQQSKDFYAKYGVKPASTAAVGKARESIEGAKATASLIRKSNPNLGREDIAQVLLHGQPAQKDGSPALPKTSALWASVVLDLIFNNGAISKQTGDRLHAAGYEAHQLGVPAAVQGPSPKPPKLNPSNSSLGKLPGPGAVK